MKITNNGETTMAAGFQVWPNKLGAANEMVRKPRRKREPGWLETKKCVRFLPTRRVFDMRLNTAKKKYRKEWIAFQYTNREKREGKVLFHARDRHAFDAKLLALRGKLKDLYLTFTGPLVPKGTHIVLGPML
jgi:hypothetical protein